MISVRSGRARPFLFSALLFGLFFCASLDSWAQSNKVPPFRMTQSNGKLFTATNLPLGKPIMIIYFSPDCDHCQVMMKDWFKKVNDFKKASVAMITFSPIDKVITFEKDFKVNQYPNIVVGTEGLSFFVRNYYQIMDMPFAALYDKNGNLIASYQKNIPLNELADKLKKLK
ncbi:MAG TPA: redoxin domain-containing protein [Niabella sp.]|nr:redoxin domain-containing protein [Niabella sp.]HRB34314.1 redoxin domain-containing protein [Niabella sp.]HRB41806.1 redoxin domain-containing protein [Niabella sp.]HRB65500.1 redoxin domain-containing protein [Niabella sp.]HRB94574.1 redoxin domain-containing protein [Niabella sp.]